MRKHKFRVWSKDQQKFFNSSNDNIAFLMSYLDVVDKSDNGAASFSIEESELSRIVIQEATGCFDKNGIEIYEGDILLYDGPHDSEWIGYVFFDSGSFKIKWTKALFNIDYSPSISAFCKSSIKIVDHIFNK